MSRLHFRFQISVEIHLRDVSLVHLILIGLSKEPN